VRKTQAAVHSSTRGRGAYRQMCGTASRALWLWWAALCSEVVHGEQYLYLVAVTLGTSSTFIGSTGAVKGGECARTLVRATYQ
jgi:hypothetical protein